MTSVQFAIVALFASLVSFCGCFPITPAPRPVGPAAPFSLPFPRMDEVLVLDGRRLSIQGFEIIRSHLQNPSKESALWASKAVLSLQNESRMRGHEVTPGGAVMIARYALQEIPAPEAAPSLREFLEPGAALPTQTQMRDEIEKLIHSAAVQANAKVLDSL